MNMNNRNGAAAPNMDVVEEAAVVAVVDLNDNDEVAAVAAGNNMQRHQHGLLQRLQAMMMMQQEEMIMAQVVVVNDDLEEEHNNNAVMAEQQRNLLPIAVPVFPAAAAAENIQQQQHPAFEFRNHNMDAHHLGLLDQVMADMQRQQQQLQGDMQQRHADMVARMANMNLHQQQQQAAMHNMILHLTPMTMPIGPISPFLMDLIRENLPCNQVLTGSVRGCRAVLDRITTASSRDEVYFTCPQTRRTPLHQVAANGNCLCMMRAILAIEPRLASCVDVLGNTPLNLLLLHGCAQKSIAPHLLLQMVNLLLQLHPGNLAVTCNKNGGYGPLHMACSGRASESMIPECILSTLLQASAGTAASRTSSLGELPLHLHCNRSHTASVNIAQLLVQFHPAGIHQADRTDNEWTPLHYACAKSNTALIIYLVETDPQAASVRAKNGETPLHVLCRQKQRRGDAEHLLPAVMALIRAAPEAVVWKTIPSAEDVFMSNTTNTSYTPLHYLTRASSSSVPASIVQALVQADPACAAIADGNQYLPLHYACEGGSNHASSVEIIACLLSAHPDSAKAVTRKHDTALHLACATNTMCVETVQLLLQHHSAATLMSNDYGFIPLHCLARAYQPSLAICKALLEASPASVQILTNAGESVVHLASSNCSVSVAVLVCLTRAAAAVAKNDGSLESKEEEEKKKPPPSSLLSLKIRNNGSSAISRTAGKGSSSNSTRLQNKIGSTPLHDACIHNSGRGQIESLSMLHPAWITMRNNAGFSPLQILCKSGRIDDALITLFSRIAGPSIFQTVDLMGNTPLHSAMRQETNVEALQALIRAFPEALHMKTVYDDTPLILACLRRVDPKVVEQVAICSCAGWEKSLAILMENTAGQTPIGIAMEEFNKSIKNMERGNCLVHQEFNKEQQRAFDVLAVLVKLLHYGPPPAANNDDDNDYNVENQSLVRACVALHRKCSVRLDPVFIRRALRDNPEEARLADEDGNYPLHFEASIPVEKMLLLNGPKPSRCGESCHDRMGILRVLIEMFPDAAKIRSAYGCFPLSMMVQNGRPWDDTFALVLRTHPEAFHWISGITSKMVPHIVSKVARTCGTDTLFALIHSRPDFIANASRLTSRVVATSAAPANNNNNGGNGVGPSNAQQQQP